MANIIPLQFQIEYESNYQYSFLNIEFQCETCSFNWVIRFLWYKFRQYIQSLEYVENWKEGNQRKNEGKLVALFEIPMSIVN